MLSIKAGLDHGLMQDERAYYPGRLGTRRMRDTLAHARDKVQGRHSREN